MTQRKSADRSRWPSQPLTDEEWQERTDQIRALRQEGLSVRAIAQAVGTSVGTVHTTLKLLDSPSFSPKQNRERGRAAQWVDKHFDKTIEALGEANHWLAYLSKDLETLDCVISLSASAELQRGPATGRGRHRHPAQGRGRPAAPGRVRPARRLCAEHPAPEANAGGADRSLPLGRVPRCTGLHRVQGAPIREHAGMPGGGFTPCP